MVAVADNNTPGVQGIQGIQGVQGVQGMSEPSIQSMIGILTLLQSVQQDTKNHAIKLAEIQFTLNERAKDLVSVTDEMRNVTQILQGSANREGVTTKIAVFDKAIQDTSEGIKEVKSLLESLTNENVKGRWALTVAIITGILGLVGLIVSAILHK